MLSQLILKLAQQAGTVTTRTQQINDIAEFLLDNIPYGKINPSDLIPGFVEYDGPAQGVRGPKKSLQWHFGGEAFEITKAIRIRYTYTAYYEGAEKQLTGSLFVGFQVPAQGPILPPAPNFADPTGNLQAAIDELRIVGNYEAAQHPSTILTVAEAIPDLGIFVKGASPYGAVPWDPVPGGAFLPSVLKVPVDIQYDGPAQTYDSGATFPYSQATLFQNREKYDQLLWWYFGGKPYGITKAIKVPYTRWIGIPAPPPAALPPGIEEFVFFGYQGPGNYP